MMKRHKKQLLFASLLTLLPMLMGAATQIFFPEVLNTGWGPSPLPTMMYAMPVLLLGLFWLCIFFTARDNTGKNQKVFSLTLWIIPLISNLGIALAYSVALGAGPGAARILPIALGLMFTLIGNYMPKTRRNSTIGIRVSWTLASDENWDATHRFAGKVWFIGGIIMMLCACLPGKIGIILFIADILLFTLIPIFYSYRYYKKQAQGGNAPDLKQVRARIPKWAPVFVAATLIFVCIILFTGNIEISCQEEAFTITADFYDDLTVRYDVIDTIEYRENDDRGYRAAGFGSGRLLMGSFENEEFGLYTRYSYTDCDSCIVLTSGGKVLVLSGRDEAQTREIYEELAKRVEHP